MTHLAASIHVQSVSQALADALAAKEQGADLVELRLDSLIHHLLTHPSELSSLLEACPLPVILTCRLASEGGSFTGDDLLRLRLFEQAVNSPHPPAWIDVELASFQRNPLFRRGIERLVDHPAQVQPRPTGLILSSHDFSGKPPDLEARLEAMANISACKVMKLAWLARDVRDALEALAILHRARKPTIALAMGEHGLASRILAKKFAAFLSFAAVDGRPGTAPGQPTIRQLKHLYRWDLLRPSTRVLGVIGWPVGHSLSPLIHNAGFDALALDAVYVPMPVEPTPQAFQETLEKLLNFRALDLLGLSVTIPHKENLLRFALDRADPRDRIEPLARRIGAANTLAVRPDGSLEIRNTDYAAALETVCTALQRSPTDLTDLHVAVIGAGGAARAVVAGFLDRGACVTIFNRTLEKAQRLAQELSDSPGSVQAQPLEALPHSHAHVYINCTPVGMYPQTDQTPLPPELRPSSWGPHTLVFDTVYNPRDTRLLRDARAAGCRTADGLEMFLRQAAAQFELWTAQPAPLEAFQHALEQNS